MATEDLVPESLAFPSRLPVGCHDATGCAFGLTKRELFAAMAMQGLLASESEGWQRTFEDTPAAAVRFADALLKELTK